MILKGFVECYTVAGIFIVFSVVKFQEIKRAILCPERKLHVVYLMVIEPGFGRVCGILRSHLLSFLDLGSHTQKMLRLGICYSSPGTHIERSVLDKEYFLLPCHRT